MGDTPGSPDDTGSTGGTVVDMCLAMFIMRVVVFGLKGDQVQMTMPHAALGTQCVGKAPDIGRWPAQDHRLQTIIVIEMTVHRRHRQVVVIVLQAGQPFGQFALVVVIDIRQIGNTVATGRLTPAIVFDRATDQVTYRLGAIDIAAGGNQFIELARERRIQ